MTIHNPVSRSILSGTFRRRQAGSLMLDSMVVLFVTSLLVGVFARQAEKEIREDQIQHSRAGILILAEALYAYRINELDSGGRPLRQWPADLTALSTYAPAFGTGGRNGVGKPYVLVPPSPLTSNQPIVIRTDMLTAEYAELLRREFPGNAQIAGTDVSVEVPVPGHEPARDSLLALDGSRDMTGNLGMGANNISNAAEVRVNTQVQVGSNVISPDIVRFLNDAGGLNCTEGVTITGGTPTTPGTPSCMSIPACPPCPP